VGNIHSTIAQGESRRRMWRESPLIFGRWWRRRPNAIRSLAEQVPVLLCRKPCL